MYKRRLLPLAAALALIAGGLWQLGGAGWIHAKAWLAQGLLEASWSASLARAQVGAGPVRPWPWADTWPVARLDVPGLGIRRVVLAGASGRTLAFGPGHMAGTAAPGTAGHAVLSGHRDTHFRFLKDLAPGDALRVQRPDGGWRNYRVTGAEVIDARHARLAPDPGRPVLSLVTCYPFDAVAPGGPLRYVVTATGTGNEDRRLLDHDGQRFANFSDLKNKKSRPFGGTDVVGHHVPARNFVQHVAGAEDLRRLAFDLNFDRALEHVDEDVSWMGMIGNRPAGSNLE